MTYHVENMIPGRLIDRETGEREAWQPMPDILTPDEAGRFLRFDEAVEDHVRAVMDLRTNGVLVGTKIGKHVRFMKLELLHYVEEKFKESV